MNAERIKRFLWDKGYLKKQVPDEQAVDKLLLTSREVRDAIAEFQAFNATALRPLTYKHHGQEPEHDGVVGPATAELIDMPRCACPDVGPDVEMATGSGSWPAGCHPDWPNNHAFTVSFNNSPPSYLGSLSDPNSVISRAWELCRLAYADMGMVFIREDGPDANTQVIWTRGAGWIGLAIVPNRPQCHETIWAKFDNRYSPNDLVNQWARLLAHEFGHNMGKGHTSGGVMNPYILSGEFTPTEWRGDPTESTFRRWFGGKPVDIDGPDDPGPGPGPDPEPGEMTITGELTVHVGDKQRKFITIPKPEL